MELLPTSNGFVLTVTDECGPVIEWKEKEDEVFVLLPARDKHGRPDPGGRAYVACVKRHAGMSPSVSVYPVNE